MFAALNEHGENCEKWCCITFVWQLNMPHGTKCFENYSNFIQVRVYMVENCLACFHGQNRIL